MASLNELIPFILHFEAGVAVNPRQSLEELYERATLRGFANDKYDRGGATMCGVTIATYTEYCRRKGYPSPTVERLKAMSYEQWRDILKSLYWDRCRADEIKSQPIANIMVDWVWASGAHGIKGVQRLLDVEADGLVGDKTLAAINAHDPAHLFRLIHQARHAFVEGIVKRSPSQAKWLRGWKRRIDAITFMGINI